MSVELGSIWIDNDSDLLVIVKSLKGSCDGKVKVVFNYVVRTGNGCFEATSGLDLFLNTKTKLVRSNEGDYSKGYEHGVQHMNMQDSIDKYLEMSDNLYFTEDEVDNIIDDAFEEGYARAYNELQTKTERERALQEKAWGEGYDQAIDDLIESGVIGESNEDYSEDDYSECGFGEEEDDEDDGEEEYCFAKELDRILNGAFELNNKSEDVERKHSHYFKDVRHLDYVDIYQVCKLFEVEDPSHCTQHSIKKLLMSGKRGVKDKMKDIIEARDTLNRYLQIEGVKE